MDLDVVLCRSKSNVRGVGFQCSKAVFGCFRGWPYRYNDFRGGFSVFTFQVINNRTNNNKDNNNNTTDRR